MKLLDLLKKVSKEKGVEFVLIGGHAINAYGDRRQTADIDLLVCEDDKNKLKEILLSLNYQLFNENPSFLQFSPQDMGNWPVDCILVNSETFSGVIEEAKPVNVGGEEDILVPSIHHLIAMKLHSLKQAVEIRKLKDLTDIIFLVNLAKINVEEDNFKALCLKYASEKVYKDIIEQFTDNV